MRSYFGLPVSSQVYSRATPHKRSVFQRQTGMLLTDTVHVAFGEVVEDAIEGRPTDAMFAFSAALPKFWLRRWVTAAEMERANSSQGAVKS